MKEYSSQCVRIALTMLIAVCLTSCSFLEIAEASLEAAKQQYKGSSYDSQEASDFGVGLNVAYLLYAPASSWNTTTSFLLPADEYRKYQLAYGPTPQTFQEFGRRKYHYRPSLTHRTSAGKFLDHFGVLSGLQIIQKNSKDEETKVRLTYLQVPILAIYTHDLSDDRKVFGGLGPYLAFGLGGKFKGPGFNEKAFNKEFGFKRFDAGLTFTAGYKFNKKWSVRLAYDLGLANIEHESFDKTKNRTISVNVGYWPQLIQKLVGR